VCGKVEEKSHWVEERKKNFEKTMKGWRELARDERKY
jgi:hypothetical protein